MTGFDSVLSGTVVLGAATGILLAFWSNVKALALRACGALIVRTQLEDDVADAVLAYLWRRGRRSGFGSWGVRRYGASNTFVRPLKQHAAVAYEGPSHEPTVFWLGWAPVSVSMIPTRKDGSGTPTCGGTNVSVACLRGTIDLETLIVTAVDALNASRHGVKEDEYGELAPSRFRVETFCGRGSSSDLFGRAGQMAPARAREASASASVVSRLNRLLRWRHEDLDGVFKGRDNRLGEKGGGLTFDYLLNCVSGVEAADGLLLVVTTSHVEDLDPALGIPTSDGSEKTTRPGRIDRAVELPPLDAAGRRAVAVRILAGYEDEVDELVRLGATDSGAQFTERCARRALELYWAPSSVPLPPREAPCPPPTSTRTTAG